MTQTLPGLKPPRFQGFRTIAALTLREMSSTYGRSPGGYVWAVLQPVAAIMVLALAFSLVLRAPSLGNSFILFYATGYLPFSLYGALAGKLAAALRYSKPLLAYPRVTWLDAILSRLLLNLLTNVMVLLIVIGGILWFTDARATLDPGPIMLGVGLAAAIGIGVGLMNCLLIGLYPLWGQVWAIVSRPLFLASGIFFTYEDMPSLVQDILWWNPILHAVGEMRRGFYATYEASYVSLAYGYGLAGVLTLFGLLFLRRYHKQVLEN
ncbi:ABC transporter permease (plasmid) [Limimaricola variabilis]|jgi:capsular polysaccharide transport system permease protein